MRSDDGPEILIHLGLETVSLNGAGFTPHVAEGARVRTGDLLLSLDMDVVVGGAKSLISPVLLANEGEVRLLPLNRLVVAGEPIMAVRPTAAFGAMAGDEQAALTRAVRAPLPHGLHARPASRIAAAAKGFDARVRLILGDRSADAASLTAMMTLGLKDGDDLILSASGPQAEAALEAIATLILSGLGEGGESAPVAHAAETPEAPAGPAAGEDGELIFSGVMAAPGLAIGRAVRLRQAEIETPEQGRGVELEQAALQQALSAVRGRIEASVAGGGAHRRAILAAHLAFLDDPGLIAAAQEAIDAGAAGFAWRKATQGGVALFRSLGDARTAERADDLMDLERQVLIELSGEAAPAPVVLGTGSVILADDLLPSQLIALDAVKVAGLCTARGGPTSHVAILAAAMGVPALVAVGPGLDRVEDGALVVLDADGRRLVANPSAARQARAQSGVAARDRRRAEAHALASDDCRTADGVRIEVFANLGAVTEAAPAVAGRRGLRPAADRIPLPRTPERPDGRRATGPVPGHRRRLGRTTAGHPHPRCGGRQAHALSAHAAGGQSGSGPAGRPGGLAPARPSADPAACRLPGALGRNGRRHAADDRFGVRGASGPRPAGYRRERDRRSYAAAGGDDRDAGGGHDR